MIYGLEIFSLSFSTKFLLFYFRHNKQSFKIHLKVPTNDAESYYKYQLKGNVKSEKEKMKGVESIEEKSQIKFFSHRNNVWGTKH